MRKWIVLGITAALAVGGCKQDEAEAPAAPETAREEGEGAEADATPEEAAEAEAPDEPEAHPVWPDVDLDAELETLQGTWTVRAAFGGRQEATWTIEGDKLEITGPDGETTLGKVVLMQPGEIGVKEGGQTSYYAYARDGEDVWIGLGTGGVKAGDAWYVGEDRGVVVFDGEACRYHDKKMSFGGGREFEAPIDVECELQEGGDQAVLHYQVPVFMKEGEFKDRQVRVVGDALLDDQLRKDHAASRAGAE